MGLKKAVVDYRNPDNLWMISTNGVGRCFDKKVLIIRTSVTHSNILLYERTSQLLRANLICVGIISKYY